MNNHWLKVASLVSICTAIVACGGSGQDKGTPANIENEISGRVIDGYVARATVFIDTNNNGTRDAWEAYAFTDDDGYYSYNPITDTDYCAADATAAESQYCLVSRTSITNAVIRVDSGYDVQTGEPFVGQMSRRVVLGESSDNDFIVSPLTTLATAIDDEQTRRTLLSAMGISEDDLDVDYLGDDTFDSPLLSKALRIHKVVAVMSDRLTDTYSEIGENLGTPNDASHSVYQQLASQLRSGSQTLNELLASQTDLISVINEAEAEMRSIYEHRELTLPADLGSEDSPSGFSRVTQIASQIPTLVESLMGDDSGLVGQDVEGRVRLLESVVVKSLEEGSGDDFTIDNAISFITGEGNQALVDALSESLGEADAFVSELADNDFSGDDFDSPEDFEAAVSLPEGAEAFSFIAGKTVRLSDPDLGYAPNNLKDIEVAVFFQGDEDATEGSFRACGKYIDGASSDGSLGEGNTRGEVIDGYWTQLNASENNESYSILLTIEFLGASYQSIIKPAGYVTVDGEERYALRFDFGDDIRDWHTENGFVQTSGGIPSTNLDCQQLLPSRVGI